MPTFTRIAVLLAAAVLAGCTYWPAGRSASTLWRFDHFGKIGNAAVTVEGKPDLIETGAGPALRFDGVADGLFVASHPLAGASTFTIEAVFRPEGGPFEQRWLHLAETDRKTGEDTGSRMLMEIRVTGERWYLDAFVKGPDQRTTLVAPEKTFSTGRWYRAAMTYDGATLRSYVDGVLQAETAVPFQPQGEGRASVGMRINRIDRFKGAIYHVRFTPRALPPDAFAALPEGLNPSVE